MTTVHIADDNFFHLTYCTNIHAAHGWKNVLSELRDYATALKARLSPNAPFGIGLRLSAEESAELLHGDSLDEFRGFLVSQGLYVAVINGFPFGSFHNRTIKADVFAPDWRDEQRVAYTLRLVHILKRLLPENLDGGISTCPLSYKAWIAPDDNSAWELMTRNVARVAAELVKVKRETNRFIHLDIEPEPDGLIENTTELLAFFESRLLTHGATYLADNLKVSVAEARDHLLEHIQVCFDTCHYAIEYEDPEEAFKRFARAGIKIGRIQISSALKIIIPSEAAPRAELMRRLAAFDEPTYLHQVIEREADGTLNHYPDLKQALPTLDNTGEREWRVHFHVPLFVEHYGLLGSTQSYNLKILDLLREQRPTRHLEIETYTWDVLPRALKQNLLDSIHREYLWVLDAFRD